MKKVINLYKKHKVTVDNYLSNLMKNIIKNVGDDFITHSDYILSQHKYIQLIYAVDENFKQFTPVICKKRQDTQNIGADKSHYFHKMNLEDNMYISNPYIHYRTGKASISVVYYHEKEYYVFDINLIHLLEDLKLIEFNQTYDRFKRGVYIFGAAILALVAIVLISHGILTFGALFIHSDVDFVHDIFKAIIAVTLGLAIFDLAKQIFEHEVLFQSFNNNEDKQYVVLGKFMISIIIALSIETLLVVFKIALSDQPTQMLSAFYLIVGVTMMFVGLAWFYKTIKQSGCDQYE
jgi:hypothetical protein